MIRFGGKLVFRYLANLSQHFPICFWYILIFTVDCGEDLAKPLLKYLNVICEDEIIGLDGRAQCLASALCVFNVLFSSNENIANMILKGNVFGVFYI